MPVITIQFDKSRSADTKRAVAAAVSDAIMSTLGGKREWVTILFENYDREDWAIGGELQLDRHGPYKPPEKGA